MRAVFENKDGALFPNQFVNIKLLLEVKKEALVIPAAALQRGRKGEYVYVVDETQTVVQRPVKSGYVDGEFVVIENGLALGESVVIDGTDKLKDGAKVKVVDASASQPDDASGRKHRYHASKEDASGKDSTQQDSKTDSSNTESSAAATPKSAWHHQHKTE